MKVEIVTKNEIRELMKNMAELFSYCVSVLPTDTSEFRVQITIRPMFPRELLDLYGDEPIELRQNRVYEIIEATRFLVKRGYGLELNYGDESIEINIDDVSNLITLSQDTIDIIMSSSSFNEFCSKLKDIKERIIYKANIQSTGSYDITLYPSAEYLNDEIQYCFDSGITFDVVERAISDFLGCSSDSPAQEMYYHKLPLTSDIKFVPEGDLEFYEKLAEKSSKIMNKLYHSNKTPYLKQPLNDIFSHYMKEYKRHLSKCKYSEITTTESNLSTYNQMSSMW